MADAPCLVITDTVRVDTDDSADAGDAPDAVASWTTGLEVRFVPQARDMTLADTGERHQIDTIKGIYNPAGELRRYATEDGQGAITGYGPAGVSLPDLTSPLWVSPFNPDEASWKVEFGRTNLPNAGRFDPRGGPIRPGYEGETRLGVLLPQAVINGVPVVGGAKGDTGRGIESTAVDSGNLVVTYDDDTTQYAGALPTGPQGPPGPDTQGFYTQKIQPYSTNLIPDPRVTTSARWSKTNAATPFDTTGVNGATLIDANANGNEFIYPITDMAWSANATITAAAFFTLLSGTSATGRVSFIFLDASNVQVGTFDSPLTTLTASEQRVSYSATSPANTAKVRVLFYARNMVGNANVRVRKAMAVAGTYLPDYFDGSTALGVWSGATDNSTSLQLFPNSVEVSAVRSIAASSGTPVQPAPVTLTKAGDVHTITSLLGTQDLALVTSKTGSKNGAFNLVSASLGANAIWSGVGAADDISPLDVKIGYVGGNHGFPNLGSFANPDGKTTADLGSRWTDGTREYVLLQIATDGRLILGGSYTVTSGVVDYAAVAPTVDLTHVAGATKTATISNTGRQNTQLWPSINNIQVTYRLDGRQIITDGTYTGRDVVVRETYDIMAYDSLYDLAKANVGVPYTSLPVAGMVRVSNAFRFSAGGTNRVWTALTRLQPTIINMAGGIQSFPPTLSGATRTRHIPGVGTVNGYDWTAGVNIDGGVPSTYILASDAPNGAPFCLDVVRVGGVIQFGWAFGYLPYGVRGDEESRDAGRFTTSTDPLWWVNVSTKVYPHFAKRTTGTSWTRLTSEAFRTFLTAEQVTAVLNAKGSASAAWAALDAAKGITPRA